MKTIEKELKALLYNFWIIKEDDKELYYQIKNNQTLIKDFISKNLGSNLIIHNNFIKLEKIPTIIKSNAGLLETKEEYIMLTIILLFLENKTNKDYFILSDLTYYIKTTAITLELNYIPDWNKTHDRKYLYNVIKLLEELKVIKLKDKDKTSFIENKEAEALYESKGISNYLMRMFNDQITDLKTKEDFIKNEFIYQDEDKKDIRRYKVFRNILYTPAVSSKDLTPTELDYIKKNRNYIQNEIDKNLNMEVEITHNLTILYDEESNEKDNFPNSKKLTDIVLMLNEKILNCIKTNKIMLDNYEVGTIKEQFLEELIKELKKEKAPYIGKTLLNETDKRFYELVLEYMEKYGILERKNNEILIYPTVSRLIGKTKQIKENNIEQTTLFGGNYEL